MCWHFEDKTAKGAGFQLAALGGFALLILGQATPASADPGRHQWRSLWDDQRPHQSQDYRRHRERPKIILGSRRDRNSGGDPDRYFGPGPGSYECYGYDCIW